MDNTASIATRADSGPTTPPALPPGWRWAEARIEPVRTPRGLLARGGMMRAKCDTGECRRRIDMDLNAWIEHGHGDSELSTLSAAYRCGHLRCGLDFNPEYFPKGIPLQYFVGREERIEVLCASCEQLRLMTAEQLIAALLRAVPATEIPGSSNYRPKSGRHAAHVASRTGRLHCKLRPTTSTNGRQGTTRPRPRCSSAQHPTRDAI